MANYRNAGARRTWTEERRQCLRLDLRGTPKYLIAARLRVSVNTVTNWAHTKPYQLEFARCLLEETRTASFRRRYQTNKAMFMASAMCIKSLKKLKKIVEEPNPNIQRGNAIGREARILGREFRGFSDMNRRDEALAIERLTSLAERIEAAASLHNAQTQPMVRGPG